MTTHNWCSPQQSPSQSYPGPSDSDSASSPQVLTPPPSLWEQEWLGETGGSTHSKDMSMLARPRGLSQQSCGGGMGPDTLQHAHVGADSHCLPGAADDSFKHCARPSPTPDSASSLLSDRCRRELAAVRDQQHPSQHQQQQLPAPRHFHSPSNHNSDAYSTQDQILASPSFTASHYDLGFTTPHSHGQLLHSPFTLSSSFGPSANSLSSYQLAATSQPYVDHFSPTTQPSSYSTFDRTSSFDMSRPRSPRAYAAPSYATPALTMPGRAEYGPPAPREPPRTMPSAPLPQSPGRLSTYSTSLSSEFGGPSSDRAERLRFPILEQKVEVFTEQVAGAQPITPDVIASVDKNIFLNKSDGHMTCYRRNYIAVQCHYELTNCPSNAKLYINHPEHGHRMVQAFGVLVSATIDDPHGKSVLLLQHTPKRDKGPKDPPQIMPLGPSIAGASSRPPLGHHPMPLSNGPNLPLQNPDSSRNNFSSSQHTFERIQFQQATANNGRRRAQQQFYHLIVQLHADIRSSSSDSPQWVLIAQRISDQLVVRGRSPGHYKDTSGEGPSAASGGGGGGHGSRQSYSHQTYPGATRSSSIGMGYTLASNGGLGGSAGGMYRGHQSYMQPSPTLSQTGSSASSCASTARDQEVEYAFKPELGYRPSQELPAYSALQVQPSSYNLGSVPMKVETSGGGQEGGNSGGGTWQSSGYSSFGTIGNAGFAINAGY